MPEHTPAPTPTRAVYGFSMYLLFMSFLIIYILWAFIPQQFLEEQLGLTYLPDKYFALYVPILLLVTVAFFAFFIYPSLNLSITDNMDSVTTIRDSFSLNRCQHINKFNQLKCDTKINISKCKWDVPKYCAKHSKNQKNTKILPKQELHVINYCDCAQKETCYLLNNPNYLNILSKRTTVPTVSDLNISDVCKHLYGNND